MDIDIEARRAEIDRIEKDATDLMAALGARQARKISRRELIDSVDTLARSMLTLAAGSRAALDALEEAWRLLGRDVSDRPKPSLN